MDFKFRILVACLIVVLLAGLYGWYHYNSELNRVISTNGSLERDVEVWRDKAGRSNAKVEAVNLSYKELKNSNNEDIKALREDLGKLKNFVSRISVQTNTQGSVTAQVTDTTIIINGDTTEVKRFRYEDKWVSLQGKFLPRLDSVKLDYSLFEDLTIDQTWERDKGFKNWFKPKKLKLTARSENPNSSVYGARQIQVVPNPKKWYETRGFQMVVSFGFGAYVGSRNN